MSLFGTPATTNIAHALKERSGQSPDKKAILFRQGGAWNSWTFRELDGTADLLAAGLGRFGLNRGMRTALLVRPGPEFFALTFALLRLGAVPVFVDPGLGRSGIGRCLAEAEPEAFIGIPLAHLARALLGWARRTIRLKIVVGPSRWPGMTTLRQVRELGRTQATFGSDTSSPVGSVGYGVPAPDAPTRSDETAAILFTSGSTGTPKGAIHTHATLAAQAAALKDHFRLGPDEIDVATFPLFALFDAALGITAVIPEMDFTRPGSVDPENILGPIQKHGATHLFGSPALLDRVGRYGAERGVRLASLRRVVSAGAPVAPKILERFQSLLSPQAQVHTPYGATEALPVASIASGEVLAETRELTDAGQGICVGRPVGGVHVWVIRISDEPIPRWSEDLLVPDGAVGEIAVRGPNVSRAYYNRAEATSAAKIPLQDGSVAHRMGDLGYLDEKGRLWFCGRKSHRVVTPGGTLYTVCCEAVFNAHPRVRKTALVGVGPELRRRPVLVVEPETWSPPSEDFKRELLALGARHEHTRGITTFLFRSSLPVDIRHNAKIDREKLSSWAARRLA